MDPILIGLIIGVILIAITLFLIFGGKKESPAVEPKKVVEAAPAPPAVPVKPDDLNLIEGIGPKISGLLKQHGITTFAKLAATDASVLQKILVDNGLQFVKPHSWPEQARLAAAGKMDELKAYQEKLTAGR